MKSKSSEKGKDIFLWKDDFTYRNAHLLIYRENECFEQKCLNTISECYICVKYDY